MSAKIPEILDRLSGKLQLLVERHALVKAERDALQAECEELQRKIVSLTSALQQANTEIEYLRISHKIAPTEDDVLRSRILLTELVKKIDKCISQLRND